MPVLTETDIPMIRERLGDEYADLSDTEVLNTSLLMPVEQAILAAYPLLNLSDDTVKRAAAFMVAASVVRSQPAVQSEKLANTTITYAAGGADRIAAEWERQAWAMLDTLVGTTPSVGYLIFSKIGGRR